MTDLLALLIVSVLVAACTFAGILWADRKHFPHVAVVWFARGDG